MSRLDLRSRPADVRAAARDLSASLVRGMAHREGAEVGLEYAQGVIAGVADALGPEQAREALFRALERLDPPRRPSGAPQIDGAGRFLTLPDTEG
jgi:hypothetical protein